MLGPIAQTPKALIAPRVNEPGPVDGASLQAGFQQTPLRAEGLELEVFGCVSARVRTVFVPRAFSGVPIPAW